MRSSLSWCKSLKSKRFILIVPTLAVGSGGNAPGLPNAEYATKMNEIENLQEPQFKAVGQPPSVLAVNCTPSVPIYTKKGSIISMYGSLGSLLENVTSRLWFFSPFKSFIYGNHNSLYQKILSTSPFSLLISTSSKRLIGQQPQKAFTVLSLDGTLDWAILDSHAIHSYFGSSLIRKLYLVPRYVSKRFAKVSGIPPSTYTGLFKWYRPGYTLLSGRGTAALTGRGNIYNVQLAEGEKAVISKNNLLGLTVNGPSDLQNSVIQYNSQQSRRKIVEPSGTKTFNPFNSWSDFLAYSKQKLAAFGNFTGRVVLRSARYIDGTNDLVVVSGPKNLLLQSDVPRTSILATSSTEHTPIATPQENKSVDYLNYVTIDNGLAKIESTSEFRRGADK